MFIKFLKVTKNYAQFRRRYNCGSELFKQELELLGTHDHCLGCNIYCDMGHPVIMVISEDP